MSTFLAPFVSETLLVDHGWNPDGERANQQRRLLLQGAMATHAGNLPRRGGQNQTPAEMAFDKRYAKLIVQKTEWFLHRWGGNPAHIEELYMEVQYSDDHEDHEAVIIQGAQVVWQQWWTAQKAIRHDETLRIATHAVKCGYKSQGNSMVNLYRLEIGMFEGAMQRILAKTINRQK